MGKRAQNRRAKKEYIEKERREIVRQLENAKNPWANFWLRVDFWIYSFCLLALLAFPFVRPDQISGDTFATIHTSMGDIKIELYNPDAPKTVDNFTQLSNRGYYNNLIWHRVIKGFVIQSGDPKGDGTGGESAWGGTFNDEINATALGLDKETVASDQAIYQQLSSDDKQKYASYSVKTYLEQVKSYTFSDTLQSHHVQVGSLAMANSGPNTNGSQFFIVTDKDQPSLDGQYTVFGKVISGQDIAVKISQVEVDSNDKPVNPVYIKSIEIF